MQKIFLTALAALMILLAGLLIGCAGNTQLNCPAAALSAPAPQPGLGFIRADAKEQPNPLLVGLFTVDQSCTHHMQVRDWVLSVATLPDSGYAVSVNGVPVDAVTYKDRIDFRFPTPHDSPIRFNEGYIALDMVLGSGPFCHLHLKLEEGASNDGWYIWGALKPIVPAATSSTAANKLTTRGP